MNGMYGHSQAVLEQIQAWIPQAWKEIEEDMATQELKEGWGEEDGAFIHLASEAAVQKAEDGVWVVLNLEDEEVSPPFPAPQAAMLWVENRVTPEQNHVSDWMA